MGEVVNGLSCSCGCSSSSCGCSSRAKPSYLCFMSSYVVQICNKVTSSFRIMDSTESGTDCITCPDGPTFPFLQKKKFPITNKLMYFVWRVLYSYRYPFGTFFSSFANEEAMETTKFFHLLSKPIS